MSTHLQRDSALCLAASCRRVQRSRGWSLVLVLGTLLHVTARAVIAETTLDNVLAMSPDQAIMVVSDRVGNETRVHRTAPGYRTGELLWKLPGYFQCIGVSNDGESLVAAILILPLNATDDDVVLTFVRKGRIMREVTVKQLLGSSSMLRKGVPIPKPIQQPTARSQPVVWTMDMRKLSAGRGLFGPDEQGLIVIDSERGFIGFDISTGSCVFPPNNGIEDE